MHTAKPPHSVDANAKHTRRKSAQQAASRKGRAASQSGRRWLMFGVLAVMIGLIVVAALRGGGSAGVLSAAQTTHDFGDAPIKGGLIIAQFPLSVQGETLVTDVRTSWMCTRARLVQADQTSPWFGMSVASAGPIHIRLQDGQPAYLEVSVDPAAHGDQAFGPITRSIGLRTANGQTLEFIVRANVTQ